MVRITLDSALAAQLAELQQPVELFTAEGERLGFFLSNKPMILTVPEARRLDLCPFTEEELAEMRQESGGQSLESIWKELGRA